MNKLALKELLGSANQRAPLLPTGPIEFPIGGDPNWSGGSAPMLPQDYTPPSRFQAGLKGLLGQASGEGQAPLLPFGIGRNVDGVENTSEEEENKTQGGTALDPLSAKITAVTAAVGLATDLIDRYGSKGRARRKLQDSLLAQQAHAVNAKHRFKYGSKGEIDPSIITRLT